MWMHLYLKMDSLIKCFLFSLMKNRRMNAGQRGEWHFPQTDATVVLKEGAALDVVKGICALHLSHPKCTHSSEHTHTHTHTVNTHPEQWAAIYAAAPGEQLGVQCLAQGHLSRGIEGGESAVHSLPPPTIPAGNLWVTSPTL